MSKTLSRYVLPVRIYLEDTDAQGIVYNAAYFRFMERSRTEWLRGQGIDHNQLREKMGIVLVVARMETQFKSPAQLDDLLYVAVDDVRVTGARFFFEQSVRREAGDGKVICEGICEVTCMDTERHRLQRFPSTIMDKLNFFEKRG